VQLIRTTGMGKTGAGRATGTEFASALAASLTVPWIASAHIGSTVAYLTRPSLASRSRPPVSSAVADDLDPSSTRRLDGNASDGQNLAGEDH
jgi:hypothetical protein